MRPQLRRSPPKRQGLIRRPVQTRMDASAELVRLEYERDKLTRQMTEFKERYARVEAELDIVAKRAAWLHAYLDEATLSPPATMQETIAVTVNVPVPASARRRTATRKAVSA
ncbi:MAG: hypothetical protein ACRC7G_17860 [Beijerinckiaceae bacterium]